MTAETICVCKLPRSDLGRFAAHRAVAASKQRAVS